MTEITKGESKSWERSRALLEVTANAVADSKITIGKFNLAGSTLSIKQADHFVGMSVIVAINDYMTQLEDSDDLTSGELLKVLADVLDPKLVESV
jgi:hypothetical protein